MDTKDLLGPFWGIFFSSCNMGDEIVDSKEGKYLLKLGKRVAQSGTTVFRPPKFTLFLCPPGLAIYSAITIFRHFCREILLAGRSQPVVYPVKYPMLVFGTAIAVLNKV